MKIALPSDDRRTLAVHFGRAAEFALFDVNDGRVGPVEFRPNEHEHTHESHDRAEGSGSPPRHDFDHALRGANVVICRGLGRRAQEALATMGINVIFAAGDDLAEVASRFARGELSSGEPACGCDHTH